MSSDSDSDQAPDNDAEELILRSGEAQIPGQSIDTPPPDTPQTTSYKRGAKNTNGPLTGRGGASGGGGGGVNRKKSTASRGSGRRGGGTLVRLTSPTKREAEEICDTETEEVKPKRPRPDRLPVYVIGIDLGMWGFGRASASQQAEPAGVSASQHWPQVRSNEFKAPSRVAFAEDNAGNGTFRGNTRELVGFKVTNDMTSVSFFKASLDGRPQQSSFDHTILRDNIARNLVSFQTPARDERAALAVLKYVHKIEIDAAKKALKDLYARTNIHVVLTHPAACSATGKQKLDDLAKQAGLTGRRSDKLKLLSESQAACMAGFVSHMAQVGGEAYKTTFKQGDYVTTLDIGSLTVDTTTEEIVDNDPTLSLSERLRSEGGRCGTVTLHLLLLRAIAVKFGFSEDYYTPQLVGRGSNFHDDCETELEAFGSAGAGDECTVRLALDPAPDHDDYDDESETITMQRHEIEEVIDEWLEKPKQILRDQWIRAEADFQKRVKTTVICGGAAMMDIIFEKLEDFCRTYDWEINAIRPRDPISAVCKGAVISELCPNLLGERLLRSSYGIKLYQNGQTNMKWLESKGNIIDCKRPKTFKSEPGHLILSIRDLLNRNKKFQILVFEYDGTARDPADPNDPRIHQASQIVLDASRFSQALRDLLEGELVDDDDDDDEEDADDGKNRINVEVRFGVDVSGRLHFDAKYKKHILGKGQLRINATKAPSYAQ